MCRSDVTIAHVARGHPAQVQLRTKWGRPCPRKPTTKVASIMQAITYRAERRLLALHPLLVWEPISRQAVVTEGARAAPTVHAWPEQQTLLPFPRDGNDLHGDRSSWAGGCVCRGAVPGVAVARSRRRGVRGHIGRVVRRSGSPQVHVASSIAARLRCEGVVRFEPVHAIVAEHGCLPAPRCWGRGRGAMSSAGRPRHCSAAGRCGARDREMRGLP